MNQEPAVDVPMDAGPRGTMHWSEPEARDFLAWIWRAGGSGTGREYVTATDRMHPNNGAESARRWLGSLGVAEPETCVTWTEEGKTPAGRVIGVYRLRADVMELMRYGLLTDPAWAIRAQRDAARRRGATASLF